MVLGPGHPSTVLRVGDHSLLQNLTVSLRETVTCMYLEEVKAKRDE